LGWPLAAHTGAAVRPHSSKPSIAAAAASFETRTNNSARGQVAQIDQSDVHRAAQTAAPADPAAQPVPPTALERPPQPQFSTSPSSNASPLKTVVIEAGDNLSSIAEQYLGSNDPAAIRRLIAANPQISDTNLIHPGEIVHVPSEEN
jgi:nucleoid-associated protein YgaU